MMSDTCRLRNWSSSEGESRQNPRPRKKAATDRFIPSRRGNPEVSHFNLTKETTYTPRSDRQLQEYHEHVTKNLFGGHQSHVLNFAAQPTPRADGFERGLREVFDLNRIASIRRSSRYISENPERILDAPELMDDFYLNLIDWNDNNILAVALGQSVYLWNAENGAIQELMQVSEHGNYVTSISWIQKGSFLAIGTQTGQVQLWDTARLKVLRVMNGHLARVGALAWNNNVLSSGSRDSFIFHHDTRQSQHHIATLEAHKQEVCGLQWCPEGRQLASGGNDNLLHIWDAAKHTPRFTIEQHQAAVKALAWSPHQRNLLASGGGTADKSICFWNSSTGTLLNSVDTQSQVCSLLWSKRDQELVSSHGFSHNQLILWKYPSMCKMTELTGHSSRVLHLAQSPDGSTIVSAAADETLRFWRVFRPGPDKPKGVPASESWLEGSLTLR